ncbi:MAG: phytoene desaturase [Deltaproteobacteria bacterium]|nr:phytoene desaturase [Nannocystaceae bacterium]
MGEFDCDVAVIGAGIGGLASALSLAAAGLRVTVFEQHDAVGGKMAQAIVDGLAIDCGPTVLTMRGVFDELFEAAGTRLDDHVQLRSHDLLARHAWSAGTRLDLFTDIDRSAAAIEAFAGARDAAGYRRFCKHGDALLERLDRPFMRVPNEGLLALTRRVGMTGMLELSRVDWQRTLWTALGDFFEDPRLRQLFARYATYYGSSPFEAPGTLSLIAEVERRGVWSLEGGMISLARAIAALIEAKGGTIALGRGVAEVRCVRGRVHELVLDDGTALRTSAAIYNGEPARLASGALGADMRRAVSVSSAPPSLSAMTWSIVGHARGFPLAYHNVFFGDDYRTEFDALFRQRVTPVDPTVYVCAPDRREGDPGGRERLFCLTNAPADPRVGDDAEPTCRARMEQRLRACGLDIEIEAMEFGSPSRFAARFPGTAGALYGSATHGAMAPWRRHRSRTHIPNLWLVGGAVHPGAGVPMVAQGGMIAAQQLLAAQPSMRTSATAGTAGGTSTGSTRNAAARSR